jgi:hypothetical protein
MSKPTHAQIHAVRKVLYDEQRMKQTALDVEQVNLLMNLIGQPLPLTDPRIAVGDGPDWVIPDTGAVDPAVLEAAGRCQSIASTLLSMRGELSQVDCPAADKQLLMKSLHEQAEVWSARSSLWMKTTAPDDVSAAVRNITAHQQAAFGALKNVQAYLRPATDFTHP